MDDALRTSRSRTFSSVAGEYARSRPTYPDRAVDWLVGTRPARVLELGAGTGLLTGALLARGHDVVATDPSGPMLAELVAALDRTGDGTGDGGEEDGARPGTLRVAQACAEALPFPRASFDLVVVAQAYHWFDEARALPELARVLAPGGSLALVWNLRDEQVPWVRRLGEVLGSGDADLDWLDDAALATSPSFGPWEREWFGFWQDLDREGLVALARSRSYVAAMDEATRADLLDRVGELYDEQRAAAGGVRLRYVTACVRTPVRPGAVPAAPEGGGRRLGFGTR